MSFAKRFQRRFAAGVLVLISVTAMSQASADQGDDAIEALTNTTCSKQQVINQIRNANPVAWTFASGQGDAMKLLNAVLDDFLNKSPQQRRAALNDLKRDFPESYSSLFGGDSNLGQTLQKALTSCGDS